MPRYCQQCTLVLKPYNGDFIKLCEECKIKKRALVNKRNKEKAKAQRLAGGLINGKPPQEHYYKRYIYGAKKRDIQFSLTLEEFCLHWQKPCYYCGSEIKTIGLDRFDSKLSYTPDNIVSCCTSCNFMKRNMHGEEFVNRCREIALFYRCTK